MTASHSLRHLLMAATLAASVTWAPAALAQTTVVVAAPANGDTGGTHLYEGRDFFGGDIAAAAVAPSLDACSQQCSSESRCVAFTFVAATRLCYLKSSIDQARNAAGTTAGVLAARVADPIAAGTSSSTAQSGDLDGKTTSCTVPDSATCQGCAVTCPQGTQAACTRGAESLSRGCAQPATCQCTPRS